ncbi:MAG: thioredoxin [Deltaproteobacteria bacterium]|nr:thioredoxin [Deltaproteobacteria bacterium]MBW2020999.1 thioredoxin [Deltaproteobacteria bacterium]MBW2075662.1 thioredoxin [Deltaproteobacteria bacterium]RLB81314.1 MAG: thioredoxin [Deltaproteobacteria bacterium]
MVEHLTKETFQEKIFDFEKHSEWHYKGDLPCVIDFYADWCGPCKMVAPIIEELAQEYEGRVCFYKVNTQMEQDLAAMFGIQSIPSILFVPTKDRPQMAVGALPKAEMEKAITDVLKVA